MKDVVDKQNELIKELISRMDQQQKYIDERLEERDRKLNGIIKGITRGKKSIVTTCSCTRGREEKRLLCSIV